ncbi:MAG: aldo/keto reductase [Eubacteriales bacterium]|nr:aldo/keto reductase [Eubacteriales bacterium]
MKKLGFGLMRLPRLDPADAAKVDIEQLKKMVDLYMEKGFDYFDTAIMYNGFASQGAIRQALVERYPRESFRLATKLHSNFVKTLEERDVIFSQQLEQTGAGYFDYYLLHGIDSSSYPKYETLDCFRWILDKKDAGLIRHAGFSYHDGPELLDEILTKHPEMEFVQLQINYLDWESEWIRSREVYEVACKHSKPVIIMEPVKGGTLAAVPEEAERLLKQREPELSVSSWAIRFAASLDNVMMVLSGMTTLEQMQDNVSYMENFRPLTQEEVALTHEVARIINSQIAIPCTGCSYCTDGCPQKIAIPQYFSLYNEDMRENLAEKGWTVNYSSYGRLSKQFGRAADCIACGQCEEVCPQHLPIIEHLKAVSEHYDR